VTFLECAYCEVEADRNVKEGGSHWNVGEGVGRIETEFGGYLGMSSCYLIKSRILD